MNTEFLLSLILNTWTNSDSAKTQNAIVWAIFILAASSVIPGVANPTMNAINVIKPIIIPWYITLHVIPFVNIPLPFLLGFLCIIFSADGSTANAKAGNESVTKFIHNIWIGNNGSKALILVILNHLAKSGVIKIATNNTMISPTLLDNKNCIAFRILS